MYLPLTSQLLPMWRDDDVAYSDTNCWMARFIGPGVGASAMTRPVDVNEWGEVDISEVPDRILVDHDGPCGNRFHLKLHNPKTMGMTWAILKENN